MKNKQVNNVKVGLMVIAGMLFLIFTLYKIGQYNDIFGATIRITAAVNNVNGLMPGNNVRFKGINIGTVKSIDLVNDTSIHVTMAIDRSMKPYIKKNALTTIGTDGLMGYKIITIHPQQKPAPTIEDGDIIFSQKVIETDDALRTLGTTNNNLLKISQNLLEITDKINKSNSLWALISDTIVANEFRLAVSELNVSGANAAEITRIGRNLASKLESENGSIHKLLNDTTLYFQLASSINQLQNAGNKTTLLLEDFNSILNNINEGEGTATMILTDSTMRNTLMNSALSLEEGLGNFNQNMEALQHNFLFRRYFRRLEKQQNESKKNCD